MVVFSQPIFFPSQSFPVPIRTVYFHVTNIDRCGVNTVYESQCSKSYFFDLNPLNHHEFDFYRNPTPFLHIITNDKKASLTESVYQSTSKYLNKKFKVSLLLTHFFKLQKVIPKRIQHKYFTFLRDSLYKRLSIIESRYNSTHTNNCSTRTFICFTYKKYRFILGIFIPCCYPCGFLSSSPDLKDNNCCTLPTSIVYSRYNNFCHVGCSLHNKLVPKYSKLSNKSTTTPSVQHTAALANIHQKWSSQSINRVYSTRKGLSYCTKISATSEGHNDLIKLESTNLYMPDGIFFTSRIIAPINLSIALEIFLTLHLILWKSKHRGVNALNDVSYTLIDQHHLSKGVYDKRLHLTQYLPITKSVPAITDTRITRGNRDQIEYIPLPEDIRSSMSYGDYVKYKDFFSLKPVFLGKSKRRFALSPGSDHW
ncbi:hypothetical protein RclHR1_34890001 [Rhizophagus clarus]|uniref:Uncharacterized protein n=1 Tax=Rhizophagus clarus TaxID=94130 RepID=A0A2Z6S5E6_9GLOM|nr:hypothetical protein RclHR1_34890001 [Rhizophagus clarus]